VGCRTIDTDDPDDPTALAFRVGSASAWRILRSAAQFISDAFFRNVSETNSRIFLYAESVAQHSSGVVTLRGGSLAKQVRIALWEIVEQTGSQREVVRQMIENSHWSRS
jgi:hypothetical protein